MKYIVDKQATSAYADQYNEPCDCIYCRNYERMFEVSYPDVIEILKAFGIPVGRPLEVIDYYWNDTKNKRRYESYYSVKGQLFDDQLVIYDRDAVITLYCSDTDKPVYGNTGMENPYFILGISNIELPWVLTDTPTD